MITEQQQIPGYPRPPAPSPKPNPFNNPDGFSAKDGLYYLLVLQYIGLVIMALTGNPTALEIVGMQTAIIVAIVTGYGVHEGIQTYGRYRYYKSYYPPGYGDYTQYYDEPRG